MTSRILTIFALLLLCGTVNSQEPFYKSYNWGETPSIPQNIEDEKVILNNTEIVEFIFEDDFFLEYQINHLIEFINSDEQVQKNNQKYVPFSESSELVEAKIRVIKPNNDIVLLDSSKILTAQDENTQEYYKYFALEGLEPGSIIDYYYVLRKYPSYNGSRKFIQDEYKAMNYHFELLSPTHLDFKFKIYNDSAEVKKDTNYTEKNRWVLDLESVEALKDEESSPHTILLKQLVYKLDRNYGNNTKDLSSLGLASTNVYNRVYSPVDKKDNKVLNSLQKELRLNTLTTTEEKIIAIENYVKDNINQVSSYENDYASIASVVKLKSANETGMLRLLCRLFEISGINFQIVLTSDRTSRIFDEEFESFHFITDYLIYFPETKKFIAPTSFEYRYPLIPWEFTDNKGLFIKEVSLGDYKTGIGKVGFIPPLDYNVSSHKINVEANIPEDLSKVDLKFKLSSTGYYAIYIQPYYSLFNEEMQDNFMTEVFEEFFSEAEIQEWNAENGEAKYVGKKPFIQEYIASTSNLIDQAGDKYLFKVGKLIGRQVELYSETERKLPVNDSYKRQFTRKMVINIPEGFYVKNIEDLKVYADYKIDGKTKLLFDSQYSQDNNVITININEYYDQISYELDEYESYRKVVNSAADFEKVVLVLEKR